MSMTERWVWERAQCEYVEAMLFILSKAYQGCHKDKFKADAKRLKVLRSPEDEPVKPINILQCLLPEIEKCVEEYPELEEIVKLMYEEEIVLCLSEVDNLRRKLHG